MVGERVWTIIAEGASGVRRFHAGAGVLCLFVLETRSEEVDFVRRLARSRRACGRPEQRLRSHERDGGPDESETCRMRGVPGVKLLQA